MFNCQVKNWSRRKYKTLDIVYQNSSFHKNKNTFYQLQFSTNRTSSTITSLLNLISNQHNTGMHCFRWMLVECQSDWVFCNFWFLCRRQREIEAAEMQNPVFMTELRALRQHKDELEGQLGALQDSRKQLMSQLESLMKTLKVCGGTPCFFM